MAHQEQKDFCWSVKKLYQSHFKNTRVLDCGSMDINGNNHYLFSDCDYTGVDIGEGRNVDVVSKIHEIDFEDGSFDVVLSTECLEHDMYYPLSLQKMVNLVKDGGLLVFTCATTGRRVHGTSTTTKRDSPFTSQIEKWKDYYKNLTEIHIRQVLGVEELFSKFGFQVNDSTHDLYFYGLKRE